MSTRVGLCKANAGGCKVAAGGEARDQTCTRRGNVDAGGYGGRAEGPVRRQREGTLCRGGAGCCGGGSRVMMVRKRVRGGRRKAAG
jgi:hypothetical protein